MHLVDATVFNLLIYNVICSFFLQLCPCQCHGMQCCSSYNKITPSGRYSNKRSEVRSLTLLLFKWTKLTLAELAYISR